MFIAVNPRTEFLHWLKTAEPAETLYRVIGNNSETWPISWEEHPIVGETEKCWYINHWSSDKPKRILKGNGKRFAHETKQWALESFIRRSSRREKILQDQLQKTKLSNMFACEVRMAVKPGS
jgi:hypothetical protein